MNNFIVGFTVKLIEKMKRRIITLHLLFAEPIQIWQINSSQKYYRLKNFHLTFRKKMLQYIMKKE